MAIVYPYYRLQNEGKIDAKAGLRQQIDIERGAIVSAGSLRLSYTAVKGGGGNPNTGYFASPFRLIDRFRVVVNDTDVIWDLSGEQLYTACVMTWQKEPYGYAVPLIPIADPSEEYFIDIPLDFKAPGMTGMRDIGLDLRRANTAHIEIQWAADFTRIWSVPESGSVTNVTAELSVDRVTNGAQAAQGEALFVRELLSQDFDILNDSPRFTMELERGGNRDYRRVALVSTRGGYGCRIDGTSPSLLPILKGPLRIRAGANPFSDVDLRVHTARQFVEKDLLYINGIDIIDFVRDGDSSQLIKSNDLDEKLVFESEVVGPLASAPVSGDATKITMVTESIRRPRWTV